MPYLWIDGVYGRDTNAAGIVIPAFWFSIQNPDNPATWVLGQVVFLKKDDIIDVMAHIRGEST
jgi:hypothetical protein